MRKTFGQISGIYADAAASALKPDAVIRAEGDFMAKGYANAGRGVCARATAVDEMVAIARQKTARFIGADTAQQVIFTSGATSGLNRVANMLKLTPDDVVIVSDLDHHSARLPFMMSGAKIEVCPLDKNLKMDSDWLGMRCAKGDVRAVVITAMSNVIGAPQDVAGLVADAHGAFVIIDAAQYVAHSKIDVKTWGADAVVFSAHKIYAGTGLGVMYLKDPNSLQSDQIGGGSIAWVDGDVVELAASPEKFEAGTLPFVQIAGLGAALDFIENSDLNYPSVLAKRLSEKIKDKVEIISSPNAPMVSFYSAKHHALDIGAALGAKGICVRAGTQCASWIHKKLNIPASVRVSFGLWNDEEDVDQIAAAILGL